SSLLLSGLLPSPAHPPHLHSFPTRRSSDLTNAAAPWPELIHAHSSPFSCPVNEEPVLLTHPPAGFWSVMVSAYSWPPTMENPSCELLTKFAPQLAPRSDT